MQAPLSSVQALALTKSLATELSEDRPKLRTLADYYAGRQPMRFATAKFQEAFGGLFKASAVNWCPLVVAAVLERLRITGFRNGNEAGDKRAWEIWQYNNLDADSDIAHLEALKFCRAYVMVGPGGEGEPPLITIESPLDVIHRNSTTNRRKRSAALRIFVDDDGTKCATLYTPTQVWRWRRNGQVSAADDDLSTVMWEPRMLPGRAWPEVNGLGVVPLVPLLTQPELDGWGNSELAAVIPLQDMVNKTVADMLVASEFVAMPQRTATGLDIERDPVTNQPVEPFKPTSRLWQSESTETKFGEFTGANLGNYVEVLTSLKQDIATITRTPPHYFYLSGQFPSGEAIQSAEAGLVAKARERMLTYGEAWEEVMRLAFIVDNRPQDAKPDMETMWADPEYRSESVHTDAVMKKQALGVPWLQLMEDLGYSPPVIARMDTQRQADMKRVAELQASALAALPPGGVLPATVQVPGDTRVAPHSAAQRQDERFAAPPAQ
jgi:hypothetical protein